MARERQELTDWELAIIEKALVDYAKANPLRCDELALKQIRDLADSFGRCYQGELYVFARGGKRGYVKS